MKFTFLMVLVLVGCAKTEIGPGGCPSQCCKIDGVMPCTTDCCSPSDCRCIKSPN